MYISFFFFFFDRIHLETSEQCPDCVSRIHKVNVSQFHDCIPTEGAANSTENENADTLTLTKIEDEPYYASDFLLAKGFHFFIGIHIFFMILYLTIN